VRGKGVKRRGVGHVGNGVLEMEISKSLRKIFPYISIRIAGLSEMAPK
jgi:hypothetical protein